jgi:hypothetical protein
MRATNTRHLGRTAVELTVLGFGGSQVGNLHRPVPEDDAVRAIAAAWDLGVRYFDTAPLYDHGRGERRMGEALRGRPRDSYVLSTKVGRLVEPHGIEYDYSHDGVLRSLATLQRRRRERSAQPRAGSPGGSMSRKAGCCFHSGTGAQPYRPFEALRKVAAPRTTRPTPA